MPSLFRNATLVQLDPPLVRPGDLRTDGGHIVEIGAGIEGEAGDEIIECEDRVLMPGLVNGHTHLYSALAAGMPPPPRPITCFHETLQLIWWRLDRAHDAESVRVSGLIGAINALRCGTTTLIDHHASPSYIDGSLTVLQAGIGDAGCRAVLCYEATDRNGADGAQAGLAENDRYAGACAARADHLFAALVGAHASFTLSDASLAGCVELGRRHGVGVHIHAAEDPVDERLTREQFGRGLIERFERSGLLDVDGNVFAHGTHFAPSDIAVINGRPSLTMAHNPRSNMNNGVGYAPVVAFDRAPMLGTDGIDGDMFREAQVASFKSYDAHRAIPFGHSLAMLGTSARRASESLGVTLGRLEFGAAADLVLLDWRPATPLAADNLAGHLLYALGSQYVRDVMVDGRWKLRDGAIVSCDEVEARGVATEVARGLHERMSAIEGE